MPYPTLADRLRTIPRDVQMQRNNLWLTSQRKLNAWPWPSTTRFIPADMLTSSVCRELDTAERFGWTLAYTDDGIIVYRDWDKV